MTLSATARPAAKHQPSDPETCQGWGPGDHRLLVASSEGANRWPLLVHALLELIIVMRVRPEDRWSCGPQTKPLQSLTLQRNATWNRKHRGTLPQSRWPDPPTTGHPGSIFSDCQPAKQCHISGDVTRPVPDGLDSRTNTVYRSSQNGELVRNVVYMLMTRLTRPGQAMRPDPNTVTLGP